jgi:hypothetical protein
MVLSSTPWSGHPSYPNGFPSTSPSGYEGFHCIFYVDGHMFLGSISEPLDLIIVNYLSEESSTTSLKNPKRMENVRSHIFNQLDAYRNEGFSISTICYDSESVLKSIAPELIREEYKVNIVPAGRHGVARMDRKIRMIKERCRCILSTLPYEAPSFMIPWCVKFVVNRITLIRRKESTLMSNESPREAFTGKKTDFNMFGLDLASQHQPRQFNEGKNSIMSITDSSHGWQWKREILLS